MLLVTIGYYQRSKHCSQALANDVVHCGAGIFYHEDSEASRLNQAQSPSCPDGPIKQIHRLLMDSTDPLNAQCRVLFHLSSE